MHSKKLKLIRKCIDIKVVILAVAHRQIEANKRKSSKVCYIQAFWV